MAGNHFGYYIRLSNFLGSGSAITNLESNINWALPKHNSSLLSLFSMPRPLRKSVSLPLLRMKRLHRQLSFVHLAPIPEVPLKMPINADMKDVEELLDLVNSMLEPTLTLAER